MFAPVLLVHLADCHLDVPGSSGDPGVARRVRDAATTALERGIELALTESADAIVIAGDLFDGASLRARTELRLPELFARATDAGIAVVIASGNHDAASTSSAWERIAWPAGVTLVGDPDPRPIPIERDGDLRGIVIAAGHERTAEDRNLARAFPIATTLPAVPLAGLLHCQVHDHVSSHDRYAPCSAADLAAVGYDYWALGHVHAHGAVAACPAAYYAGSTQGRHVAEVGAHGALLVHVESGRPPDVRFHDLAPIRFATLTLDDLTAASDLHGLLDRVVDAFAAERRDARPDVEWMLRVDLRGRSPIAAQLATPEARVELAEELTARLDVLDVEVRSDRLDRPRAARTVQADDLLALALALARDAATDETLCAELVPALAGGGDDPSAYARSLLDDIEHDLVAALVPEDDA